MHNKVVRWGATIWRARAIYFVLIEAAAVTLSGHGRNGTRGQCCFAVESFGVLRLQLVVDWTHLFAAYRVTVLGIWPWPGMWLPKVWYFYFEGLGLVFASIFLWAAVVV